MFHENAKRRPRERHFCCNLDAPVTLKRDERSYIKAEKQKWGGGQFFMSHRRSSRDVSGCGDFLRTFVSHVSAESGD